MQLGATGSQFAGSTMRGAGRGMSEQAPVAGALAGMSGQDAGYERDQASGKARGYLLGQAALDAVYGDRSALGEYASQFVEAAASKDSDAVANLITRLTMSDHKFRTQVLPTLQRRTAEGY
jgi:hypothetical protein